jgi:hypothetical protein
MRTVLLPILSFLVLSTNAQLVIDDATFFIGEGAVVTVQGNLTSNVAIQAGGSGATLGKIQLKGSGVQQINTNGFVIPRLEIDNTSNATLTGDVRVSSLLEFTNGKFQLGTANFIIEDGTVISGAGASKFLETNGSGQARRLVGANVADKVIPVGSGTSYTPFMYTTTGSTYGAGAYVGVQATGAAVPTPQRHPRTESYLATSWKVTKSGITGGNLAGTGSYLDPQVMGTEGDIVGMFWNGSSWSRTGGVQNAGTNLVGANVTTNSGEIYGMNKFILANAKVYLHGAFNNATGLMNEGLRSNGQIPLSDPYRLAPYNYPHAANGNGNGETIAASVLNAQGNAEHNVVDWVVVELMNNETPATVVQSRSVLVRRDGMLIDVDGISPVYFKNVDPGSYNLSVRHRNHVGAMTPATQALGLGSPVAYDFTPNSASAFTNVGFAYSPLRVMPRNANTDVWGLYSSDGNFNKRTQVFGSPALNDYSLLISNTTLVVGYHQRDYNMDGTVRTAGSPTLNDYSKLLNSLNTLNLVQQHEK